MFAAYTNNHRHQNIMNRLLRRLPRLGYRQKIVLLLVGGIFVGLGGLFLYLYNPQNEKLHRRETKRCLPENEAYP